MRSKNEKKSPRRHEEHEARQLNHRDTEFTEEEKERRGGGQKAGGGSTEDGRPKTLGV
jgi:hypothetical protein